MEKNPSKPAKKYSKPTIAVVELRPEERIAATCVIVNSDSENSSGSCHPNQPLFG